MRDHDTGLFEQGIVQKDYGLRSRNWFTVGKTNPCRELLYCVVYIQPCLRQFGVNHEHLRQLRVNISNDPNPAHR